MIFKLSMSRIFQHGVLSEIVEFVILPSTGYSRMLLSEFLLIPSFQ
jgi:hypothetical protein